MKKALPLQRGKKSAFTLTEIALVFGIIGIVVFVIWYAYVEVQTNNRIRTVTQQLVSISQNVRTAFAEQAGLRGQWGTLTPALDQLRVFPLDMRQNQNVAGGVIFHPWDQQVGAGLGPVQVSASSCGGSGVIAVAVGDDATLGSCFMVRLQSLPANACIRLITNVQQTGIGLTQVQVNGLYAADANDGAKPLPLTPTRASGDCNNGNNNTVTWVFLLRDN